MAEEINILSESIIKLEDVSFFSVFGGMLNRDLSIFTKAYVLRF